MRSFITPKHFNIKTIGDFLNIASPIFQMKNKQEPNVLFDLSKTAQCSVTGLLIIYKFIDYTYHNYCFKKPEILASKYIEDEWEKFEFKNLMRAYISNTDKTEREYKKMKIKIDDNFIIAPQALLRNTTYSYEKLQTNFLPKIESYYKDNPRVVKMVFTCLSELLLNFWEHAKMDNKSIIVASGNKSKIEISCADNGEGIISTLGMSKTIHSLKIEEILLSSLNKGITSKKLSNHMGYGLWIVNEIVNLTNSRLHIYSQGAFVKNDYGHITTGKCGYWQGTIVTLILYLKEPKTICDIKEYKETTQFDNLKINFS